MTTEQRLTHALEKVKSALDVWAEVPLGVQSDAVLEVVDDRMAEFYAALDDVKGPA